MLKEIFEIIIETKYIMIFVFIFTNIACVPQNNIWRISHGTYPKTKEDSNSEAGLNLTTYEFTENIQLQGKIVFRDKEVDEPIKGESTRIQTFTILILDKPINVKMVRENYIFYNIKELQLVIIKSDVGISLNEFKNKNVMVKGLFIEGTAHYITALGMDVRGVAEVD